MVFEWLEGLATLSGFLYFLTGFGSAYLLHCVRARLRHKRITIPWHLAGISIGTAAIVIITAQSSIAYNTAKDTAEAQRLCNIEFRSALLERSKITKQNDDLSQEQRLLVFRFFHDIALPPPPFNEMSTNDPRRAQFGLQRLLDTDAAFTDSVRRQNMLEQEREKHPYPDPTCGQ
jgi:hypothetical protein